MHMRTGDCQSRYVPRTYSRFLLVRISKYLCSVPRFSRRASRRTLLHGACSGSEGRVGCGSWGLDNAARCTIDAPALLLDAGCAASRNARRGQSGTPASPETQNRTLHLSVQRPPALGLNGYVLCSSQRLKRLPCHFCIRAHVRC